ncbi:MAG: hypothetical protein M3Z23_06425 [Acidobacteriota bacterium]|nr:hypothetical protein [Acidobacteriota bacterium]
MPNIEFEAMMNPTCDPIAMPPLAVWETPPCPFRIEFPPATLDEIGRAAVDAFYLVPRGGVEIGGILFGATENGCVRIESWRTLPCEYALGPSFTMSGKDRRGLTALLKETGETGLEPVGWFHSHTRSDIELSPADVELYDSFFPGKRQIALVVRPAHLEPARAGFFFRDSQGRMETAASYREFTVDAASFLKMGAVKPSRPVRRNLQCASPEPAGPEPSDSEPVRNGPMGLPVSAWILALMGTMIAAACCFAGGYWLGVNFR